MTITVHEDGTMEGLDETVAAMCESPAALERMGGLYEAREAKTKRTSGAERTYQEVSEIMGVSMQRVQQLEKSALKKLRKKLESRAAID